MRSSRQKTVLGTLLLVTSSMVPGCYKNFQLSDEEPATGGTTGEGGAGGATSSGGNTSSGGMGTGGAPDGPIATQADVITIEQGASESFNVLSNDDGDDLVLKSVDAADAARPTSLDPVGLSFEANGEVSFQAAEDFWGVYRMSYSVEDADGAQALGSIEVQVVPRAIKLSTLELGWGGFVIEGAAGDSLGVSIAGAGDVNGDGIGDLLVGAPAASANSGRVALVFGREGIANAPGGQDLNLGSAESNVQIFTGLAGSYAGASVAGAGDMNGDDFADIVIGAAFPPGEGPSSNGSVHVLWGSPQAATAPLALSNLPDSGVGFTVLGENSDRLGAFLSAGGDINFDGANDLVLYSTAETDSIHAIFGPGAEGSVTTGNLSSLTSLEFAGATLRLSVGLVGNVFDEGTEERAEVLVATIDGFALLRGETGGANPWPASTSLTPDEGWLSNIEPSGAALPSVASAGEFDGEPGLDVVYCTGDDSCRIVPRNVDPTTYSLDSGRLVTGFGAASSPRVSGGGDTNGDGFDDLVFANDSEAYVMHGQAQLPSTDLNLATLGAWGYSISPAASTIGQVALLGDINGDDLADYAVTIPTASGGAGRVYVIYGTPGSSEIP